ncbi:hypothetical protein [Dyadobacter sandarakinus]|uniref:Uncharacterized protein n=1 Tax=Dyadobacter sandarakinus TaxID=2747268 RepID=A0ABX7I8R9_9BACT|nr:hypothetical protein [Dyadobacter sandarakinus]QRR02506.1 hypothetical protein HWI92_17115 [Dyadobacter sandarakinus]
MSPFLVGYLPPLVLALTGGLSYCIFICSKYSLRNINEKDLLLVMFEFATIISAIKIIVLALDERIPLDNNFDRTYLVVGGVLTIVVTLKDITSKFH